MFAFLYQTDKRCFHVLAMALLLYELLFQFVGALLLQSGIPALSSPGTATAFGNLFALFPAVLLLKRYAHVPDFRMFSPGAEQNEGALNDTAQTAADITAYDVQQQHRTPKTAFFVLLFFSMYGLQLLGNLLSAPLRALLTQLGFSLEHAYQAARGQDMGMFFVCYAMLGAPLIEELLFRKYVLRSLLPFGRLFAILSSALLFGLMHMNVVQLMPAMLLGLLLAHTALRYGLRYAMLLHAANNVFAFCSNWLAEKHPVFLSLNLLFMLCGLICLTVLLLRSRRALTNAFRAETTLGTQLRRFFSTPGMALVLLFFAAASLP